MFPTRARKKFNLTLLPRFPIFDTYVLCAFCMVSSTLLYFHEVFGKVYPYENFLSVLALVWQFFVLVPFSIYLLGALVRLMVWLHALSKLPAWTSYGIFLPLLILLESVLGLRMMLVEEKIEKYFGYLH